MNKRRFIVTIVTGLVVTIAYLFLLQAGQPRYEGRTATAWLKAIGAKNEEKQKALVAFRNMGRDAVPFLASILERQETKIHSAYKTLHRQFPSFLRVWLPNPNGVINQKLKASIALMEIGTNAVEAMPALLEALNSESIGLKGNIFVAMRRIAPGSKYEEEAVKALIRFKADRVLEDHVYRSLGSFPSQAGLTVPILVEGLRTKAQFDSMESLKQLGPKAQDALPHLENLLRNATSSASRTNISDVVMAIRGNRQ